MDYRRCFQRTVVHDGLKKLNVFEKGMLWLKEDNRVFWSIFFNDLMTYLLSLTKKMNNVKIDKFRDGCCYEKKFKDECERLQGNAIYSFFFFLLYS